MWWWGLSYNPLEWEKASCSAFFSIFHYFAILSYNLHPISGVLATSVWLKTSVWLTHWKFPFPAIGYTSVMIHRHLLSSALFYPSLSTGHCISTLSIPAEGWCSLNQGVELNSTHPLLLIPPNSPWLKSFVVTAKTLQHPLLSMKWKHNLWIDHALHMHKAPGSIPRPSGP